MATIRTAINMTDNLSPIFRSINSALQLTISGFENLEGASGNAIDVSRLQQAQRELAKVDKMFEQIEKEIRDAENAQGHLNNRIRDGTNATDSLLGKVGALIGAYLSFQGVKNVLGLADEAANTTARLAIMNDGLQTTTELNEKIMASANRTYSSFSDTANMVSKLGILARDAFSSNDEIIAFAEILNKHFVISGTSAEGTQAAMLQLTQAMAAGALRGEELNSIFEQAPTLIQNIADHLGVSTGQIKEMATKGQITANVVKQAMFAMADQTNERFESMPNTFADVWNVALNQVGTQFSDFFEKLTGISDSDKFREAISNIISALSIVATIAETAIDVMAGGAELIYDNWSFIAPVIGAVTAALIINAAAWAWANREIVINIFMMMTASLRNLWYVATTVLSTWATYGFTAAMAALSIAISANPIGWLIGAIIVLITLFYLGVAAVNKFAGESYSATGIIAGAFAVLGAAIYNVYVFIWNTVASFLEFFVNLSTDKTYAVKKLFYNLAVAVLDFAMSMSKGWDDFATNFVNAIIKAVNLGVKAWNWFIDMLPDGLVAELGWGTKGMYEERESIVSDLSNARSMLDGFLGEPPKDYWEAPKKEYMVLSEAWNSAYNWGAGFFKSEKDDKDDTEDKIKKAIEDALALGDKVKEGNDAAKKTAKNTGKMADGVKFMNDELKYLRDLAEREAINRYTTAEIHIDNRSENHINSELDIDGIVDRFGEKVEEVAEKLAEGDVSFV